MTDLVYDWQSGLGSVKVRSRAYLGLGSKAGQRELCYPQEFEKKEGTGEKGETEWQIGTNIVFFTNITPLAQHIVNKSLVRQTQCV